MTIDNNNCPTPATAWASPRVVLMTGHTDACPTYRLIVIFPISTISTYGRVAYLLPAPRPHYLQDDTTHFDWDNGRTMKL